jgi:hypothetical protein
MPSHLWRSRRFGFLGILNSRLSTYSSATIHASSSLFFHFLSILFSLRHPRNSSLSCDANPVLFPDSLRFNARIRQLDLCAQPPSLVHP